MAKQYLKLLGVTIVIDVLLLGIGLMLGGVIYPPKGTPVWGYIPVEWGDAFFIVLFFSPVYIVLSLYDISQKQKFSFNWKIFVLTLIAVIVIWIILTRFLLDWF